MATKKRKRPKKKIYCRGQRKGPKMVRKSTCSRSRCAGEFMKGGKRRKKSVCLKPKRKKVARKRPAAKRRVARKRTKGVMSHGHMVYGAAAKAVKRKRARKGSAAPKRRAYQGRPTVIRGGAAGEMRIVEVAVPVSAVSRHRAKRKPMSGRVRMVY